MTRKKRSFKKRQVGLRAITIVGLLAMGWYVGNYRPRGDSELPLSERTTPSPVMDVYGKLPLSFEANRG